MGGPLLALLLVVGLGRLRARSIAGLFPQPPSEPDVRLVASSGSPVPLSLRPWPIVMYIIMATFAERNALPFSCNHDFHPQRHFPFPLFIQVFELSYMVHLHFFLGPAYLACIIE